MLTIVVCWVVQVIREQLEELYALYEENFQLGSFLLDRMRALQEAWEKFESEKADFERSMLKGGGGCGGSTTSLRRRAGKVPGDGLLLCSSDSGHGTDEASSVTSDSDLELDVERRRKLDALRSRARQLRDFLPPSSPLSHLFQMVSRPASNCGLY
jgi:hypothetical protein